MKVENQLPTLKEAQANLIKCTEDLLNQVLIILASGSSSLPGTDLEYVKKCLLLMKMQFNSYNRVYKKDGVHNHEEHPKNN